MPRSAHITETKSHRSGVEQECALVNAYIQDATEVCQKEFNVKHCFLQVQVSTFENLIDLSESEHEHEINQVVLSLGRSDLISVC